MVYLVGSGWDIIIIVIENWWSRWWGVLFSSFASPVNALLSLKKLMACFFYLWCLSAFHHAMYRGVYIRIGGVST